MRLAIISDTHIAGGRRSLPPACVARLAAADAIIHAGDLMTVAVLRELESLGPPVHAVHGNVDDAGVRALLPAARLVALPGGGRLGVVHDAGPAKGRLERLRGRFPQALAVVFGHSHVPLHERDPETGFQIFNPGSPTDKRRQPRHTMGEAVVVTDGSVGFALIALD